MNGLESIRKIISYQLSSGSSGFFSKVLNLAV